MPSRVARMRLAQSVESQFDTTVVAAFEAILAGATEEYRAGARTDFNLEAQEHEAPRLAAVAAASLVIPTAEVQQPRFGFGRQLPRIYVGRALRSTRQGRVCPRFADSSDPLTSARDLILPCREFRKVSLTECSFGNQVRST